MSRKKDPPTSAGFNVLVGNSQYAPHIVWGNKNLDPFCGTPMAVDINSHSAILYAHDKPGGHPSLASILEHRVCEWVVIWNTSMDGGPNLSSEPAVGLPVAPAGHRSSLPGRALVITFGDCRCQVGRRGRVDTISFYGNCLPQSAWTYQWAGLGGLLSAFSLVPPHLSPLDFRP